MTFSGTALAELTAQETDSVWTVLLIVEHPDLDAPLRFTSDNVNTTSGGEVYIPFAFSITFPDQAEGRSPKASIVIDNTSQEVISTLSLVATMPVVTARIVRSVDPDTVLREFGGMRLVAVPHNLDDIQAQLMPAPLEEERFPYYRFDKRFPGIWP